MKDTIITTILIIIMLLNGADVLVDIGLQVPMWHVAQEAFLVLLSAFGAAFLIFDMRKRTKALNHIAQDLSNAKRQTSNVK